MGSSLMHMIEILLPLTDNHGNLFSEEILLPSAKLSPNDLADSLRSLVRPQTAFGRPAIK
jgi:hypothetical protein